MVIQHLDGYTTLRWLYNKETTTGMLFIRVHSFFEKTAAVTRDTPQCNNNSIVMMMKTTTMMMMMMMMMMNGFPKSS